MVEIPSNNYQFQISTYNGSLLSTGTINWGDGTVTAGEKVHTYATAGTYTIKAHIAFGYYDPSDSIRDCLIEVKQIALSSIDKMFNLAFSNCTKLTKVTAYNLAPKRCDNMFKKCPLLTEIIGMDTWDMSNCTNCDHMFSGTSFNISRFPDNFFYNCTLNYAFANNKSIVNIDLSNQGKINDIEHIFDNCTKLEEVTMDNIDFTGMKKAVYVFDNCSSLNTINMKNCTFTTFSMYAFVDDGKLSNFYMNGSTGTITDISVYTFWASSRLLTNINWGNMVITGDVAFREGIPNATVETLVNTFNALYDYSTSGESHSIKVGATALAKLTDEQIAIATNKGWTVS